VKLENELIGVNAINYTGMHMVEMRVLIQKIVETDLLQMLSAYMSRGLNFSILKCDQTHRPSDYEIIFRNNEEYFMWKRGILHVEIPRICCRSRRRG